jgi:hypothetical protein
MSQWGTISKAPNVNLGYSYYPCVYENSRKVYVKAQGETYVNIYDIDTNTWSIVTVPNNPWTWNSDPCRSELMWVANNYLYILTPGKPFNGYDDIHGFRKANLTTGATIATWLNPIASCNSTQVGNWGRYKHKAVVKDPVSERIFLVNFYMKQIYEFLPLTDSFVLVKTWTETIGGQSTDNAAGCDAVAMNGKIYLLGKHLYQAGVDGGSAGPVEINIADWSSTVKAVYPDYGDINANTYNHYCDTAWFNIGSYIFGYGGRMQGGDTAAGGGGFARGNILRKIQFDPSANTWTDLGTIPSSLLYASASANQEASFIIGGLDNGSQTQANTKFSYILDSVTNLAFTFGSDFQSITVSWTYLVDVSAFRIRRRTQVDGSSWVTLGLVAGDQRSVIDVVDVLAYNYYYEITALLAV